MSVKISELPVLDNLADNDVLAGVDTSANVTAKVTLGSLKEYIDTNTIYTAGTNINITNNVVSAPNVYNKTETDGLLATKESLSNKVTSITSSSTNTHYPSAKSVYDHVSSVSSDIMDSVTEATSTLQEENDELKSELEAVNTIYNAFPTDSDEDTSITFDGTSETKFKKLDLKGNTTQTTYTGKNMLDTQYFEQGSIDGSTGQNISNNQNGRGSNYIPVLPNTTYTLSANKNIHQLRLSEYQQDKTHIKRDVSNQTVSSYTVTTSANTYFVRWSLNYDNSTTVTQTIINSIDLMLEQNSTASSYEPYVGNIPSPNPNYPQDIHVASGNNKIIINNKNLFNIDLWSDVTVNGSGSSVVITDSSITINNPNGVDTFTNSGMTVTGQTIGINQRKYLIPVTPNTTYTISYIKTSSSYSGSNSDSCFYCLADKNFTVTNYSSILGSANSTVVKTITTASNTRYIGVRFGARSSAGSIVYTQIQIEPNSSNTTYHPFLRDTYNVYLPVENKANISNATTQTCTISTSGNSIKITSTGTWARAIIPVTVSIGETYTLSCKYKNNTGTF